MSLENKKYDAFISYRHADLDKFVAETLHKQLEKFKIPKQIRRDIGMENKSLCVFRDQEELPLSSNLADPITEALKNSNFLIVICTPRLLESQWCKREIETFIALHGREHVLAVLAEGEPADSFPEQILYEMVEVLDEQGNKATKTRAVEPLAADVRGNNLDEVKKKIQREKLRILAPMFSLGYDDLRQRNKERKMKQALSISAAIAAVLLVFSAISTIMALQIKKQSNQISKQNEKILQQNEDITAKNEEIVLQSDQIQKQYIEAQTNYSKSLADASSRVLEQGNKMAAIYIARKGLPQTLDDPEIPYTSECEQSLVNAMYVYEDESTFLPYCVYDADNSILTTKLSKDGNYLIAINSTNHIYVWDTQSQKQLLKVQGKKTIDNDMVNFMGEDYIVYESVDGTCICNFLTGEMLLTDDSIDTLIPYPDGKRYFTVSSDGVRCFDLDNHSLCFENKTVDCWPVPASNIIFTEDGSKILILNEYKQQQGLLILDAGTGDILLEEQFTYDFANLYSYQGKALVTAYRSIDIAVYETHLICIDVDSCSILWETTDPEMWYRDVHYIKQGDQEYYYLSNTQVMKTYDATNGKQLFSSSSSQYIKGSSILNNGVTEFVVCQDGTVYIYDIPSGDTTDVSFILEHVDYMIEDCVWKSGTLYIHPKASGQILAYKLQGANKSGEIATVDYQDRYGKINEDGSLLLTNGQGDNAKKIFLKDTKTGETIASINDTMNYSQYCFVGNGNDEFAIIGNTCVVYSVKDGALLRTINFDSTAYMKEECFSKGKYFYVTSIYPDQSNIVYSTETGEIVMELPIKESVADITTIIADDLSTFACYNASKDELRLYHAGEEEPYLKKSISLADARAILFTNDAKYLCIIANNGNPTFYSSETMESVKTIYDVDIGYPDEIDYLESIDKYVIQISQGGFLLDENLNQVGTIPRYNSFDENEKSFIMFNDGNIYIIPYYTYDELIKAADEMLQGYEISEELQRKYNVE